MARVESNVPDDNIPPKETKESPWTEALKTIALSAVLAFGIRTFVAEARYIPSGSMEPTLLIGDEPTGDLDRKSAEEILGPDDAPHYTKSSDILEVWFDSGSTFWHVLRGQHPEGYHADGPEADPHPVGSADGQGARRYPKRPTLSTAAMVETLGIRRVKPSVVLSPTAQPTSKTPAMTRRVQVITSSPPPSCRCRVRWARPGSATTSLSLARGCN